MCAALGFALEAGIVAQKRGFIKLAFTATLVGLKLLLARIQSCAFAHYQNQK